MTRSIYLMVVVALYAVVITVLISNWAFGDFAGDCTVWLQACRQPLPVG